MGHIIRLARMVEPARAVHFTAAGAEIHAHGAHAAPRQLAVRFTGIAAPGIALQAVQQQDQRRLLPKIDAGDGGEIEIEKIAVRRIEAHAPVGDAIHITNGIGQHCLGVRVEPEAGRPKWFRGE